MPACYRCLQCDQLFSLPDNAGDAVLCPSCGVEVAFAPGLSDRMHGTETAGLDADFEAEMPGLRSGERSLVTILTLLGLRFSSPLAWLAAIGLFFLPWVEVKCRGNDGQVRDHYTRSGAQLAWGGRTDLIANPAGNPLVIRQENWSLFQYASAVVLTAYLLWLGGAILFKVSTIRAPTALLWLLIGIICGGSVLVFLLLGSILARLMEIFGQVNYTPWFYGSFAANLWAMLSLILECFFVQRTGRRPASRGP